MNGQSFILLAIGLFVGLIVTVAAVDEYLFNEHPPSEVSGLIWRVENALSRVDDLEAQLKVIENGGDLPFIRMRLRLLTEPPGALSVRYLDPVSLYDQLVTVQNDQLTLYLPRENILVVKRWLGVPLSAVGLSSLNLSQLEQDQADGRIRMQVLQNVHSFSTETLTTPIVLADTIASDSCVTEFSFCPGLETPKQDLSFIDDPLNRAGDTLSDEYILEVRDAQTDELMRMVWVDRETYFIEKVVFFEEGRRSKTISIERYTINQGLTAEDILFLPRGVPTIRG